MVVERSRLVNLLLVLLTLAAALFLAQMLWQLISGYADLILLFVLGWLVAFVLRPLVSYLSDQTRRGLHLSRGASVALVYLVLVLAVVITFAVFVPPTFLQLSELARHLPEYMARAPAAGAWIQDQFERFGLKVNAEDAVSTSLNSLQTYAAAVIQNALGIFTGLLSFLSNLLFVIILSFYIALDEARLRKGMLRLIPSQYHNEAHFFAQSVDRTFGGFIRGQLIQALLVGIGTVVVMALFQLDFILAASLFAGLFMLIPLIGPFLALLPPLLVVLIASPGLAVWVLIVLFLYQFIVVNVLMPRVLSQSVGLHPLLVLAALLVSIRIAGFWGAFFGIPIAGVLWAMLNYLYEEREKGHSANAK